MDSRQVFSGKLPFHSFVSAHTQKNGVMLCHQGINFNVNANFRIKPKFNTHAFKNFSTALHNLLFKFELRDTKGQ